MILRLFVRCMNCGSLSFFIFCKNCLKILSENELRYRLAGDLKVYYFYNYTEIEHLLFSKHKMHGTSVFKALAKLSFKQFAKSFYLPNTPKIIALPLDDSVKSGYSHTAILARALKNSQISPLYNALKAQNNVKYAGKTLEFRRKNPRNFKLFKKIDEPVILIDDIITTGLSMQEAYEVLKKEQIEVLFGLVLADARH